MTIKVLGWATLLQIVSMLALVFVTVLDPTGWRVFCSVSLAVTSVFLVMTWTTMRQGRSHR